MTPTRPQQLLLSLPPNMVRTLQETPASEDAALFAACDPGGTRLGSGGGTAHLLIEAWRATGGAMPLTDWLRVSPKLIIHGGGQSRRLPAYAAVGKPFLPMPVLRASYGQRLDQTLLDFQRPVYGRVLDAAPAQYVAMVTSGDILLRFGALPMPFPEVDVLALGMPVPAETAQGFGVFFSRRDSPDEVAFFRQKPSAQVTHELMRTHTSLVDTGVWLFSERAIQALLHKCGWDDALQGFAGGTPNAYELYAELGLSLGAAPGANDPAVAGLTCAVMPLPQPEFYHLGTNRQLIEAITLLQRTGASDDAVNGPLHPDQFVQNALFDPPMRRDANHTLWVENSTVPASWRLAHGHVLTGVPDNDWPLALEAGVCLDFVPVGADDWGIRAYGIDDRFSGPVGDPQTAWLGAPAGDWLSARGLDWDAAGIDPRTDIQRAPLFPVLAREMIDARFLSWLCARSPQPDVASADLWRCSSRLSAHELGEQANLRRLHDQRTRNRARVLPLLHRQGRQSIFFRLDLEATAALMAGQDLDPPLAPPQEEDGDPLRHAQDLMFRAAASRRRGGTEGAALERSAFRALHDGIVDSGRLRVSPRRCVLEDQIVWGRSPVRLDLAGGWTDTPPYCLQHGGRVVNLAVDLNGQPPIQVFARLSRRPGLVLRSIDLGVEERVEDYAALADWAQPGSEFALAKAALALAGFVPEFHAGGGGPTLMQQLDAFGGGIELSLLAAIPQGSGLGTSSMLAATLLATLSELCGLGWDRAALVHRTLVMEQMLTTGGGWQDPVGGIFPGLKLAETRPGLTQAPAVRWLPEHLFQEGSPAKRRMLLLYTGLTRLAKTILQDIVRGMFLNAGRVLGPLAQIGDNALRAADAIGGGDYDALCRAVQHSWHLNQLLDAGTNPPAVQAILDLISADGLAAAKLLGAGGGGYLLLLARDEASALAIRDRLTRQPPNPRARFVDFSLSNTGLQVTRS